MDFKKEIDDKDKQFKMLQQTLQGMQQQLMEAKRRQIEEESKVKELQTKLKCESKTVKLTSSSIDKDVITLDDSENEQTETGSNGTNENTIVESTTSTCQQSQQQQQRQSDSLNECDAKLVGIISAFLNVHPFGAGLDYIWSYVSKLEANLRPSEIELLMNRFPMVFKQELVGIGANIERRWIFNAFNSMSST